jgi:hypothetical protein
MPILLGGSMSRAYMDKSLLISINNEAIKSNRNRTLKPEKVKELPDSDFFPVMHSMIHNDEEIRCMVVLSEKGENAWLDMPIDRFNNLPRWEEE